MDMRKSVPIILQAVFFSAFIFQNGASANSENWETLESSLLAKSSEIAWRKGGALHLRLLDGKTIQLTDTPYDSKNNKINHVAYRLVGNIEQHKYFIVSISNRTGSRGLVIDRKNGQRTELDAVAVFSPDNTRFFTVDFTRYPNSKHRFQIWRVDPSGPVLEWEFQPKLSAWFDVEARWSSAASIYVTRQEYWTRDNGNKIQIRRESRIDPILGRWQMQDLPRPPDPPSI